MKRIRKTRLGLWLLAALALTLGASQWNASRADDRAASYAKWVGVWDVVAGGQYKYVLTLQATRRGIYGSYKPGDGQVTGRVYENVLRVKFTQGPNIKGVGQLKLSEDGKSFTGTVKIDGQNGEFPWTGTRRQE